jgi:hypothetical protein
MKRYIENLQQKEPHERRVHAMTLAGVLTAAIFFVWITTLGLRYTSSSGNSQAASPVLGQTGLQATSSTYLQY